MKRIYGSGIVEQYRGKFRARVRKPDGTKPTLGIFATEAEAQRCLDEFFEVSGKATAWTTGMTLRTFTAEFFEERETIHKVKGVKTDRNRWDNWVLAAEFADLPVAAIDDVQIRAWVVWMLRQPVKDLRFGALRKPRRVSPGTAKHCLNLLRVALGHLKARKLISENPADDIVVPGLDEPEWDWMHLADQHAWERATKTPKFLKYAVMWAYGTGMREADQWSLKLADIHIHGVDQPFVTFRMQKRRVGKKPKWVTVPLFGAALRAIEEWLPLLPEYCPDNPLGLAWPARDGGQRATGLKEWSAWRKRAGIARHIRWHWLRHTFGSSLVSGIWGKPWPLIKVRDVMGHSTVDVTERYAHLAPAAIMTEGAETIGPQLAQPNPPPVSETTAFVGRARTDSNSRPTAPESDSALNDLAAVGGPVGQSWANMAARYLRAVKSRSRLADRYARELAQAVLECDLYQLARQVLDADPPTYSRGSALAAEVLRRAGAEVPSTRSPRRSRAAAAKETA